eukprot:CAMPEP_0113641598 /NCGR_PEP_ID=MMETSP0017_2-20120614/21839_1 /TAXON_ID=2856 /ORGANISM="Cylindrotheca closterium" /LENGTH=201 /DNA_ID=CAMNT_0000552951 /DNA_START=86 /DNA_END=691 /DNA_ORIENTATION=- /assembly_acc=CAM_ASM_000147
MNVQATPTSPSIASPNGRPKGKFVIPQPHHTKEYPKEKFYSFLQTGVDQFLNKQLGEMDLNKESSCISSSSLPNKSLDSSTFSSSSLNCGSLLSHDLPKILEGSSVHEQQQQVIKHQTVFPDITKYCADDDTDSDDDDSFLSDSPLNDDDEEEQPAAIRLLPQKSSEHSLYERMDSSDDGSDWEVESCDDDSVQFYDEDDS